MAPIYIICRLTGIFPLSARRSKGNIIVTLRRNDYFYIVSYFLIYVSLSIYATYNVFVDEENYVIVPKVLVLSETLIVIILMLTTMFFCFFFRRLLLDCARLITDVDCTLQRLKVWINYRAAMWSNLKVFGIMIVSVFARSIVMGSTLRVDVVQQFTLFLATFIKSLSKYEFIAMLLPLSVRFNKINDEIVAYRVRRRDPSLPGDLYTLCRTHFKLCNISRRLNICFAFQLLSSLAVSLTDILFQGFYLYVIMTKKQRLATPAMMASPVVWLIDECMEIYLLVNACSTTCQAVRYVIF
ncbi:PREDICTED: uncharacterized protein LOC108563132 [Nicrophorus vespilloides]|uniref:Gustatory receptor n=1 Tax=Nicrophorus vespilloides TaxID=110193 RepID=A0ABM1MRL2_NICVS|nr:PREDICTED: uncharacterized protein LOC108563132 [Nicrophorus vespilloides]